METTTSSIETLVERLEVYGKTTYQLSKLKVLETMISILTSLISRVSVVIMLSIFVLILNIGMALLLGEWLGKMYYGFFIIAAFYLLVGLILHFYLHKWIKKPLSNFIITQAL